MASTTNGEVSHTAPGDHPRRRLMGLPRNNPCAQCGRPIARPDWVETGAGRTGYLWQCRVCNYRFEAVAFFDTDAFAA